jgi:ankyrin repeat protein
LNQQQYKRWRSVHDPDKPWQEVPDLKSQPSPLYYASLEGLEHATIALLRKGANVNAQGGQYATAICAASQRGHTQIVKLLLKHNADVNTRVRFGIKFESDLEEYQMLLMLLEQHNRTRLHRIRQLRDDTAAQAASSGCPGDVEGWLHPGYCSNALCAASAGNHMDIVSLLFESGADLNIQCRKCGNALYTACDRGHMGVVEMLIENGAEVNAQGGSYGNALQAASTNGYERVVEVLLENGAKVNTQGGHYGNALQAACAQGHKRTVEILLKKDADVNARGGRYMDALRAACSQSHGDVAVMLLEKGVNIDEPDSSPDTDTRGMWTDENTSLVYFAALKGHKRLTELLLEQGANVNGRGRYYDNALQAACARGHKGVVEVLLENGAEVNTQGGHYGNALQAACVEGYERIVELLLEKNADIDARSERYSDALQAANLRGFDKISRMLRRQLGDSCSRNQAKHLIEGQNQLSERSISSKRRCAGERLASCAVKGVTGDT